MTLTRWCKTVLAVVVGVVLAVGLSGAGARGDITSSYASVSLSSANDNVAAKSLTVICPLDSGGNQENVLGGGVNVTAGATNTQAVTATLPTSNHEGWTGSVVESKAKNSMNWTLTVYATCATI
jgi:hypothetical protein